jgi:hypothetical protein
MPNALQIRSRLVEWLDGKISLADFEDWFVPETWNIHKANDQEADRLVDDIELSLSEYSGGYLTLAQLKAHLRKLVPAAPFAAEEQVRFFLIVVSNGNISKPQRVDLSWAAPDYESFHRVTSRSVSIAALWERVDVVQQVQVG